MRFRMVPDRSRRARIFRGHNSEIRSSLGLGKRGVGIIARRRSGQAQLVIFAVAAALALAAGGWFIAGDALKADRDAKAAAADPPTLPDGRFKLVSSGMTEARYLALDTLKPAAEGGLDAVVLIVGAAPDGLEGGTALMSKRERIDCAGQRLFEGQAGYFDAEGKLKSATRFYAARRGRPVEAGDTEVAAACDPAKQRGRIVKGLHTAQRQVQKPPEGYAQIAAANPDDAHRWAWLCASAARGRWRPESPRDCDRAVAGLPDDTALRVDRGFLNLMTGKRPAADADFRKVMAQDPTDAVAIFGHSLILALNGDKAGSRAPRIRALDLDPDAPAWIEQNYRFFITAEFRGK